MRPGAGRTAAIRRGHGHRLPEQGRGDIRSPAPDRPCTPPATAVDANRRLRCLRRQQNLDAGGCPDQGVRRTACCRSLRTPWQCPLCVRHCGRLAMPSGRPVSPADTAGPQAVSGRLRNWTPRSVRCPLLLPEPRPVSGRPVSTADTADSRATGSGRRPGVHWRGAATAGMRGRADGRAGRRAGRARRSWPAAPRPAPPRR
jgi:hypothetical protein